MRVLIIFLFIFRLFTAHAQQEVNSGLANYEMLVGDPQLTHYEATLIFTPQRQYYYYTILKEKTVRQPDFNVETLLVIRDSIESRVIIEKAENILYERHIDRQTKKIIYTTEPIPILAWQLLPETKKIGMYVCQKASAVFRGRHYFAWYTSEIPVSAGPWKFTGLPGLILEVADDSNNVVIRLKRLTIPYEFNFSDIFADIEQTRKVPLLEYVHAEKRYMENFVSKLVSKAGRDISIQISEIKFSGIELNFDDLSK